MVGSHITATQVQELAGVLQGVFLARDLVNAPLNKLNATQFAERMAAAGEEVGYHTEILDLVRIEALRMGVCSPSIKVAPSRPRLPSWSTSLLALPTPSRTCWLAKA
ncbi:hypothetical protein [Hymenobacter volaticus]|uniref:hypothetical protein n=1 Tax=Hymenobacter volaticus TaxID=2932254 RepID=UPI0035CAFAE4